MRIGIDCRKAADYGIGTYVRGLVGELARIQTSDEFVLFAPEQLLALLPAGANLQKVPVSAPHYSLRELTGLARAARRYRVDVFHATHYVVPFVDVPVVVTIHDLIHLKLSTWRRHPLAPVYARWMFGRATGKASLILTGTTAVRDDVIRFFPTAAPKVRVTRFGVNSAFSPGPPDDRRLAGFGLRSQGYFLFVGNDKPHKNLERLVEAWKALRQDRPDLDLALVGGTRRLGGPGIVQPGFVKGEDLPALYRGAVALVQPSLEEGFGMPVLEAMACGTPVLISDHPALREVAGHAGILIDPRSTESITAALIRIAADASLRERLSLAGRKRAEEFSWRACAEMTMAAYGAASQ